MNIDLSDAEIDAVIIALNYSKQAVDTAQGTPYQVRQENLERLDAILAKFRIAKAFDSSSTTVEGA